MLSIGNLGKGAEAVSYYSKYPSQGDALGDEITGYVYQNEAAAGLGLSDTISTDEMESLMLGKWKNKDLVQGAGDGHRAGLDLTFSAVKSVSVLKASAELSGDKSLASNIQEAHDRAVQKALTIAEKNVIHSRIGKGGKEGHIKGAMLAMSFAHQTSRLGDMQMHSHNILMNLVHGDDGKWRTLSNEELFKSKMTLGAAYRAELALEMKKLGYSIEPDKDAFKISGVDDNLCEHFSKRRNDIEALAEKYGVTAAKTMDELAQNSKKAKDRSMTMEDIRASWNQQLSELGFTPEQILSAAAEAELDEDLVHVIARDAILEALTSNSSTFAERDVLKQAYIIAQHLALGADAGEALAQEIIADNEILNLSNGRFTTKQMLELEASTLAWAKEAAKQDSFQFDEAIIEVAIKKNTLTEEQANAMRSLSGGAGIGLLEGMAGTGKSRAMLAYKEAAEASGFKVIGAALAGKAASGLQEGAGIQSSTIHRLLIDIENGKVRLTDRDIIVIDEAAMADNVLLSRIADAVRESGSKVVLLGDARQIQAVGAGGMFDQLTQEIGSSSLTEIWRQRNKSDISAVHQFADGNAGEALQYYKENDRLHISDKTDDSMKKMVTAWQADSTSTPDKLMMTSRRIDVDSINTIARESLESNLGISTPFLAAEGAITVAEGERILFKKNDKNLGVMNGNLGTVKHVGYDEATGSASLYVELDTGETISFTEAEYDSIRYGYCVTAHASQGDTKESAYIYASKFMSSEIGYVMASRHKNEAHIFASEQEFSDMKTDLSTEERLAFVMSQSSKKETAHQVMQANNVSLADVLEGRADAEALANQTTEQSQEDYQAVELEETNAVRLK